MGKIRDTLEQQTPERIPYGMQNREDVRFCHYYHVDKTRFISEIEVANKYFILHPPAQLRQVAADEYATAVLRCPEDRFERLFGDLWVGQHPTPEHSPKVRRSTACSPPVPRRRLPQTWYAKTCTADHFSPK